jgi:catechol 2,3-dioxygenase-like lactoylglutathione lyase family enzyme
MSDKHTARLGHVGLYVTDTARMIDFYTRVLGFVVTDADPKGILTFLSRNPEEHHQVVLVAGRAPGARETVQQEEHAKLWGVQVAAGFGPCQL